MYIFVLYVYGVVVVIVVVVVAAAAASVVVRQYGREMKRVNKFLYEDRHTSGYSQCICSPPPPPPLPLDGKKRAKMGRKKTTMMMKTRSWVRPSRANANWCVV